MPFYIPTNFTKRHHKEIEMDLILAILGNSTTHLLAVLLAALMFRKQIAHHFMAIWIMRLEKVEEIQKQREDHYKTIPLMQKDIEYMKEAQSKSDEKYDVLDKKIDDLTNAVTELTALVKQDLANKNKE